MEQSEVLQKYKVFKEQNQIGSQNSKYKNFQEDEKSFNAP